MEEKTKRCSTCGEVKPITAFHIDRHSKDGRQYHCKGCHAARKAHLRDVGKCSGHPAIDVVPGTTACLDCHISNTLGKRRRAAEVLGLPFELDVEWFKACLPHGCPGCRNAFQFGENSRRGGPNPRSPTVDKFRAELGYTKANSWLICHRCNTAKSNHTPEEAMKLALWMRRVMEVNRTLSMRKWVAYSDELQAQVEATIVRVTAKYKEA